MVNFADLLKNNRKHWLEGTIDNFLTRDDTNRKADGYFHPSAISGERGMKCDMFLQFSLWISKPFSANSKTMRIFDVGNDMHLRYQRYFSEMGISVQNEAEVLVEEFRIKGHADAIIRKPMSEELALVELKSMNQDSFKSLNGPLLAHEVQCRIYMGALGITLGLVVYENKNNQEIAIFEIRYDQDFWENLISRLSTIYRLYLSKEEADRTENISLCKGCQFFRICESENRGRVASVFERNLPS